MSTFLFAASLLVIYYVYHGYQQVLRMAAAFLGDRLVLADPAPLPKVTILLTVHNEEGTVRARLSNLLCQEYPRELVEVLVASDGSTDGTNEIVEELGTTANVRLLRMERGGKSAAQNVAVTHASGEVVVLTDSDAQFAKDFLRQIVVPFADPRVGCVTANLQLRQSDGVISRSQGYYWRYELRLRELESRLGILAVASGAAMAFRRSAFVPIPHDVGDDCMIPLDCALQSLRVVHHPGALAWDSMASEPAGEFRARVRMTLRNWIGTWRRPSLLNPFRYPGYAFALWSHKLLRWLTPFFILIATGAALAQAVDGRWELAAFFGLFYALAAVGGLRLGEVSSNIPIAGALYGFCVANAGFFLGVLQALARRSIVTYGRRERRRT